jgi:predicted RNA binding protein YcfA (HicA-like mRNA interferase family)
MPKSVRELKQSLKKAGFTLLPKRGKGSHSYWVHPLLSEPVILAGKDSRDARPYQEKDVEEALLELKRLIQEDDR